jgi:hypothetical protein
MSEVFRDKIEGGRNRDRFKRWGGMLACLLGALLFLFLAEPLGNRFADSRGLRDGGPEMTLYPSGNFLKEMSLGHRHLVADLAWISSIQYYGKHRMTDQDYPLSPELFRVITDADPAFENAYLFASLVMAEAGFNAEAQRLLELGVTRNPDSWRLNFDLGFFHFVITNTWDLAAASFRAASQATDAPDYTRRFAAAAFERADDPETARVLWKVIALESPNEEIRRIAEERLAMID